MGRKTDWFQPLVYRFRLESQVLLLMALVLMAIVHPMIYVSRVSNLVYDGLTLLVVISCVLAVRSQPVLFRVAAAFGVLVVVLLAAALTSERAEEPTIVLVWLCLQGALAVLFTLACMEISNRVLHAEVITLEEISGAISIYLLLGNIWAHIYMLVHLVDPASFDIPAALETVKIDTEVRTIEFNTWIYYSFVTLSTLGYGDITPVSGTARTLSWIEAVFGQLYIAMMIARVVGLHVSSLVSHE